MRMLLTCFLLTSVVASAQTPVGGNGTGAGPIKRGNFLKPDQYATQAALALFVDATGSDSGTCASTGTGACATIQGAMNKIPFLVQHPVTVSIAAGTYVGFALNGHEFTPVDTSNGAYISIAGAAQTNTSPATGTATGTLTSVTTDSVTGLHIVTDSGQTWTANDTNIETRFLSLTGGTGVGQVCPISNNTATVLSVTCIFSPAPVAGTTYAIVSPSTRITTAINSSATAVAAAGAPGAMLFSQLGLSRGTGLLINVADIEAAGTATGARFVNAIGIQLQRVRINPTNAAGVVQFDLTGVSLTNSVVSSGSGAALSTGNNAGEFAKLAVTNSYLLGTSTVVAVSSTVGLGIVTSVIESTVSTAVPVVALVNFLSTSVRLAGVYLLCTSAAAAQGVRVSSGFTNGTGFNTVGLTSMRIEGCNVGLQVDRLGAWAIVNNPTTFLSNTTAVKVFGGGRVGFNTAVATFTTNTTDIDVDGTTATRAVFVALTPNAIVDMSYLSSVILQP